MLTFSKTFKIGADPSKGELEADPRFKYDPSFLRSKVLPAFLNRVLDALVQLMAEGIDYSCTQQALEAIQAENSHLFQFCQQTGLSYDPNSTISAGDIWERLEKWYVDQGALTYEENANGKQKPIWSPFSDRRRDNLVKSANQVFARFQSLFPKAKREVRHHKVYLAGLGFNSVEESMGSQLPPPGEPTGSQPGSLQPLQNKEGEPIGLKPDSSTKKVETENLATEKVPPLPQSRQRFKEGDRVKYTGVKYRQLYANQTLTIRGFDHRNGVADCRLPNGRITTWMPFGDLERIDSGDTQLSG